MSVSIMKEAARGLLAGFLCLPITSMEAATANTTVTFSIKVATAVTTATSRIEAAILTGGVAGMKVSITTNRVIPTRAVMVTEAVTGTEIIVTANPGTHTPTAAAGSATTMA
ncbi:hypothetical protein MMC22_003710 [Lobaria immixta]|nr:hypothetical protein [Lobaria immixta]